MRKRIARVVLIGLVVLSVALVGVIVYPFATALLFAAVLAGAFLPLADRLTLTFHGRRQLAAGLIMLAVLVVVVIPVTILVVVLGRETIEAVNYVGDTLRTGGGAGLVAKLPPPLRGLLDAIGVPRSPKAMQDLAGAQTERAAAAVGGVILATSNVLLQIGLMLVGFYFLLVDGPHLVEWLAEAAPIGRIRTYELLHDFRNVSEAVVLSSFATAGVQTVVALVGFLVTDVPQPVFFALATFIVAFIPVLGAASVSVGLAGLLYLTGHPTQALILAGWGVIFVGFSDNLLKPLLMKGRVEVHGAVIFFALVGGLAAFGVAGLVAGPLIVSFFLATVRMCRRDLREAEAEADAEEVAENASRARRRSA